MKSGGTRSLLSEGSIREVVLTIDDGMPVVCALNFDHVALAGRSRIGSLIAHLPEKYWPEVERALLVACGFGEAR